MSIVCLFCVLHRVTNLHSKTIMKKKTSPSVVLSSTPIRFCPPFCGHYLILCTNYIISASLHSSLTVLCPLSSCLSNRVLTRLPIHPNSLSASSSIYSPVTHSYSIIANLLNCSTSNIGAYHSPALASFPISHFTCTYLTIHSIADPNEHIQYIYICSCMMDGICLAITTFSR